ncbi:hypothetical protein PTRA_b0623 [Pseudoalteromonas translucida KMM 520]|uniref:Orphan protein n=1 Tax=Pseudoalteromonas translucida KMM 520 TaxID=1315283 RepID=A0A0U2VKW6_9GAMM|nr:hypothetical protein [Pseudoalteromonas translucida]ALS35072.1 hypothetical protein PTRA_b0623 [Pseudoalteromonas translucida KMM 520]
MKVIITTIVLLIIASGYYFNAHIPVFNAKKAIEVKVYSDIFYKLGSDSAPDSVSIDEIIAGASQFALSMCDDAVYQQVLGKTVDSCKLKFHQSKAKCAQFLTAHNAAFYNKKTPVSLVAEKFIDCVSL